MIKTIDMLRSELAEYRNPDAKVKRMVDEGKLFSVARGIYETDNTVPGYCIAGSIYGPSYLSFEFALGFHGIIPETVYHFTCATFEKKRTKRFDTQFGTFAYRDVPGEVYPVEVMLQIEKGYSYQIATAEKAICDMLYKTPPLSNLRELREFLFDDLRIEKEVFYRLDIVKLKALASLYKTKNHKLLISLLKKGDRGWNIY